MMQAFGFKQHGDFEEMTFFEAPIPQPQAHEVQIAVKASALNHLDIWVRKGWHGLNLSLPHISGSDAAGIVSRVGSAVKHFKVGDRVALNPGVNLYEDAFTLKGEHSLSPGFKIIGEHLPGTYAPYVCAPERNLVLIPEHFPFEIAAAAGLVSLTAWHMLIHRAKIRPTERVLIHGAGGGVNSVAIQIARLAGCEVFTTTSNERKCQQALALGAHHVVDYTENSKWEKRLFELSKHHGFDVIVDNVGQATMAQSLKLVRPGGRIVIVGNTSGPHFPLDIRYLFAKQISLIGSTMGSPIDFAEVMHEVFAHKIQPNIHHVYPWEHAKEALKCLEEGTQFGKLVLKF